MVPAQFPKAFQAQTPKQRPQSHQSSNHLTIDFEEEWQAKISSFGLLLRGTTATKKHVADCACHICTRSTPIICTCQSGKNTCGEEDAWRHQPPGKNLSVQQGTEGMIIAPSSSWERGSSCRRPQPTKPGWGGQNFGPKQPYSTCSSSSPFVRCTSTEECIVSISPRGGVQGWAAGKPWS
jgi:hypothetical protein